MLVSKSLPAIKDREKIKRASTVKWILFGLLLLGFLAGLGALVYETQTSRIQARKISRYAASLTYTINAGTSDKVVFPNAGPLDNRRGYAKLPQLLDRVRARSMTIQSQTRFSSALFNYAKRGFFTPYREKHQAGLNIIDCQGKSVYHTPYPGRIYTSFDSIPPLVVQALLFIEDRELLNSTKPYLNPAVDWDRFARALVHEAAQYVGLDFKRMGGSTLATQIEKFRHSPGGVTADHSDKLRQMVSASVRAYQEGPATLQARQQIVLTYLNSVPLAAAPEYGEVHGLGDALWVWFGADFYRFNQLLQLPEATGDTLLAQGKALRQAVSLFIAQRRPNYYLEQEKKAELGALTDSHLRLLANNGYISATLRDASLSQQLDYRNFEQDSPVKAKETDKGVLMVRTHLSEMLAATLYDLDRMDLTATTTLQHDLQKQVSAYLNHLSDPEFAQANGLIGEYLLTPDQTREVRYSFTLFQSTPQGNLVRVQTDNTDQPFDLNEGSKLELGSTAKLRVLVHYLEVIAEIHKRYANQPDKLLHRALNQPQDNLSRWGLTYLLRTKDKSLPAILRAATERQYSASPREVFFTGGGQHTFHNFENKDNGSRPTIREALQKSINLPFVRLMRDLVQYSIYQTTDNPVQLLGNDWEPRRREYLSRFADREGRMYLRRFWEKYQDKSDKERFTLFLKGLRKYPVRFAAVHRYLYPETDSVSFEKYLRQHFPSGKLTKKRIMALYHRYGPEAYNLADQGYIAGVHPLELWLLNYLQEQPNAKWKEVAEASQEERQEVYKWLLRTRFKHARDSRIRTMLELDAFKDIQQRWKRLGYPFEHLVPSYATALGSSGDRPAALAELMGIILNNGVRQKNIRLEKLHFAANTPYETVVTVQPTEKEQVLAPEVAAAVQEALAGVVDKGTAIRLQGGFTQADGSLLPVGGKTGTGDNRLVTVSASGHRLTSRTLNRTATFVFFLGNQHFGTLIAFVPGRDAAAFNFTSSLPIQVLRSMAPILMPYLEPGREMLCRDAVEVTPEQVSEAAKELQPEEKG